MKLKKYWNHLGPGILLAAASVGASHLVLSPQAGALFGFQLLWLVVAAHLFKYPAFEFGPRYAAATGKNLLQGYSRIPGPKNWAVIIFFIATIVQGIGVLASVVNVAGCVLWTWTGVLTTASFSVILVFVVLGLLFAGGFSWLDNLNKVMMAILVAATVLAFVPIIPGPETLRYLVVPALPKGSLILIAAILGWMPTGLDVSVWHSFWTIEKIQAVECQAESSPIERLGVALADMRIGYALSLLTGLMFVTMGAVHLRGYGADLRGVQFVEALSTAYTAVFGRWMYHLFMLTAFFAMFSTSYTVIDGFSRSFSECCGVLRSEMSKPLIRQRTYRGFALFSGILAGAILVLVGNPVRLVTATAIISLAAAPLLYGFNLYCVTRHVEDPRLRPSMVNVWVAYSGIAFMLIALGATMYVIMTT